MDVGTVVCGTDCNSLDCYGTTKVLVSMKSFLVWFLCYLFMHRFGSVGFRKVDSYAYRLYVPAFSDTTAWLKACLTAIRMNIAVWIWFIPLYWLYYTYGMPMLWGLEAKSFIGAIPEELLLTILYQDILRSFARRVLLQRILPNSLE